MKNILLITGLLVVMPLVHAETLSAEQIYMQNCMVCHASDGSGAMPGVSDMTENKRLFSESEEVLVDRMKQGIQVKGAPLSMPPKGGNPNLTDSELLKALKHLKKIVKE